MNESGVAGSSCPTKVRWNVLAPDSVSFPVGQSAVCRFLTVSGLHLDTDRLTSGPRLREGVRRILL